MLGLLASLLISEAVVIYMEVLTRERASLVFLHFQIRLLGVIFCCDGRLCEVELGSFCVV